MAQSTWIALAIFALFIVYITARGHLTDYLAAIVGPYPKAETGTGAGTGTGTGTVLDKAGTAVGLGKEVLGIGKGTTDLFGGKGWFGSANFGGDFGGGSE